MHGDDQISDRINATAPKVAAVLQGIRSRSPRTKIFLLGYLDILPDNGVSCCPQMPVTDGDVPYWRDKEKQLNATETSCSRRPHATARLRWRPGHRT